MSKEKEFICEFIEKYKSFPCLWKIKSKEYSDRNAKSHAYKILVELMKEVEPDANRESVVKKINSLRTTYRKELKKVAESEKSGAGEDDIYVPHLWYFELLHFLKDQELPRRTQSNIDDIQVYDNEIINEWPESPQIYLPDTPCSSNASASQTSLRLSKLSQKRNNKCDEVLDVIGKLLREPSTNIADKYTDIGKAWASKLRDLDPQQAVHAEKIVNDVFYEAQLGNLNRNCCIQIQQQHYTRNAQPPLNTQLLWQNQPPINTHQLWQNQPPINTRQLWQNHLPHNTQESLQTQHRITTNDKEKPLPPDNETTAQVFPNLICEDKM